MPGLGHVNCYALEDERGFAVVDPGLPGPESWEALLGPPRRRPSIPMARVHTVVVTHSHPDHFGLARPAPARRSGADIAHPRRFRMWWDPDEPDVDIDDLADAAADDAGRSPPPLGTPDALGRRAPSGRPT